LADEQLLQPEALAEVVVPALKALEELDRILLGRPHLHRLVLVAVLARGHVLLEGLPGLGKTELVKALGTLLELDFSRVQFTPDLMPGDIVGSHILQEMESGQREMAFRPGPIFTNILLADEINRASPKTQSALLEAMQERSVTLLGTTRMLPPPFFVLASQNPVDLEGTYPLPEAQLDRFLFKLNVTSPDVGTLAAIIGSRHRGEPPKADFSISRPQLDALFEACDRIYIPKAVCTYIARLVHASHAANEEANDVVKSYVDFGASPRAAIAIAESARAHALLRKSPTVGFDDVRAVTPAALNHRLILNYKARIDGYNGQKVATSLLENLSETGVAIAGLTVEG